jgi:hypothetical protein
MPRYQSYSGDPRWITARYPAACSCGETVAKGDRALYWPRTRTVNCEPCGETAFARFEAEAADEAFMGGGF